MDPINTGTADHIQESKGNGNASHIKKNTVTEVMDNTKDLSKLYEASKMSVS